VTGHEIIETLAPVAPRPAHDILPADVKQIEEYERHIAAHPTALVGHGLNPFVAIPGEASPSKTADWKGQAISRSQAMPAFSGIVTHG
jgi:hypothetical protein